MTSSLTDTLGGFKKIYELNSNDMGLFLSNLSLINSVSSNLITSGLTGDAYFNQLTQITKSNEAEANNIATNVLNYLNSQFTAHGLDPNYSSSIKIFVCFILLNLVKTNK